MFVYLVSCCIILYPYCSLHFPASCSHPSIIIVVVVCQLPFAIGYTTNTIQGLPAQSHGISNLLAYFCILVTLPPIFSLALKTQRHTNPMADNPPIQTRTRPPVASAGSGRHALLHGCPSCIHAAQRSARLNSGFLVLYAGILEGYCCSCLLLVLVLMHISLPGPGWLFALL